MLALCSHKENPLGEQSQRPRVRPQGDRDVIQSLPSHSAAQGLYETTQLYEILHGPRRKRQHLILPILHTCCPSSTKGEWAVGW